MTFFKQKLFVVSIAACTALLAGIYFTTDRAEAQLSCNNTTNGGCGSIKLRTGQIISECLPSQAQQCPACAGGGTQVCVHNSPTTFSCGSKTCGTGYSCACQGG